MLYNRLVILCCVVFASIVDANTLFAQVPYQTLSIDSPAIKKKKVKEKPTRYIDKELIVEQKQIKTKDSTTVKKKKVTHDSSGGFTSISYYEKKDTLLPKQKVKKTKPTKDTLILQPEQHFEKINSRKKDKTTEINTNQPEQQQTESITEPSNQEFSITKSDDTQVTIKAKKEKPKQEEPKPPIEQVFTELPGKPVQAPITYSREQIAAMLLDTGNYYLEKGRYMLARLYFDSLTNYYQNTFQYKFGFYFKAKCKMAMQDDIGAINDFNYFLLLDGCKSNFCTDTHYNLGVLKFRVGQFEQAMQELELAKKDSTYKNYKFIFFYRAFCFAQQEDYIKAIQDLTRFLNMDKGHTYSTAEAIYYRGYYKTQLQDYRGAIKDFDAAVEMYLPSATGKTPNPQHVQKLIEVYIVRGIAKSQLKKYDEAIADYNLVLKLNPQYATAYRLKALDEIKKGDIEQGCLDLSRAGELGSSEAYNDIKQFCK